MNVLILSQSMVGGGAEKLAANLSIEMEKQADVFVLTYRQDREEYQYGGIRINLDLPGGNRNQVLKIITALKRIWIVRKIKKEKNIDYTISFVPQVDYANVLTKQRGEKTVIDVVSNMSVVYPSGLGHWFRKFILHRADYVVTVSEGVRQDLINNFGLTPEKTRTIYNSCDIAHINKVVAEDVEYARLRNQLPEKYISAMGSFRHPKGHWHLIRAFSAVAKKLPEHSLVILGDGTYRVKYETLIKKLGLEGRVIMPGFANPPFSVIAHSELFVFSSVFEGFGHSVIEAMACGIPVLSTDCDYGPREILAPGTDVQTKATDYELCEYGGLLPPFGSDPIDEGNVVLSEQEKKMADAIMDMLSNPELTQKYMNKGKEYVKQFDNNVYCENWVKLLKTL